MGGIKKLAKALVIGFFRLLGPNNGIVFESTPDFSDNTYGVFCQLYERGYGKRYRLIWSCSGQRKLPQGYQGIRYIYPERKDLKNRLKNAFYMAKAQCLICCNRYLLPQHKAQTSFYLTHGTPMKSVYDYYSMPSQLHYCLCAGPGVEQLTAYQFHVPPQKMFCLGFPRNDVLTQPAQPVREMLETDCKTVIVWYPTFRQHKNVDKLAQGHALPIIHDAQAARELNEWAREMDVLLVIKPHFAQDLRYMKDMGLSNIRFIDDEFFHRHATTSYGFVAGCDSLITDYSSIYYDYMLCDKPIGLIWEDVESYRQNPGFAVDIDQYGKGGVIMYDLPQFKDFLQQVATGVDSCKAERNRLCDQVNYARDGKNAQRVTDFIIKQGHLD